LTLVLRLSTGWWRRPALGHEFEQMFQGFFVRAIFFAGKLMRAFVELRGHGGGFVPRTPEPDESFGEVGNVHDL